MEHRSRHIAGSRTGATAAAAGGKCGAARNRSLSGRRNHCDRFRAQRRDSSSCGPRFRSRPGRLAVVYGRSRDWSEEYQAAARLLLRQSLPPRHDDASVGRIADATGAAVPGKLNVLIVDDEALSCARIRRMLGGDPAIASVRTARHGEQALEMVREVPPDLLFLDVEMPGLGGFEVL